MERTASIVGITEPQEQTEGAKTGYRIVGMIRTVFVYVLAAGIIAGALMFAASNSQDKSLFGYRYYTVLTPSMKPAYSVGDMVIVKVTNAGAINVGDVITFNPSSDGGAYLTHRVFEKYDNYNGTGVTCFRTKGDANDSEDSFLIDEDRVIGVVKLGIPVLGYIVRFIQLRWFYVVPLIILLFVFFRLLGVYFAPAEEENGGEKPGEAYAAANTEKPKNMAPDLDEPPE